MRVTHTNNEHTETTESIDITIPTYNLMNIVGVTKMHLQVYGNLKEINHLQQIL